MPQRPASPLLDRRRHIVHRRGAASGGDDVRAGVGEAERERAPDPGRAADDDRGAAGEVEGGRGHRAARRFGAPCILNVDAEHLFGLVRPRAQQVFAHQAPRALGVLGADRLIDVAVRVGGVAEVAIDGALGGHAALLVEQRGDHLDQRRDDRIAGGGGDAAVEVDVVHEKHLPLGHRREQAGDLVGQRRELIGRGALGGEAGGADLQNPPRLVDVVHRELVQRGEKAERFDAERRRTVGDVGA